MASPYSTIGTPPFIPTRENPPPNFKAFSSYLKFKEFYDGITISDTQVAGMSMTYAARKTMANNRLADRIADADSCWLGKPVPTSLQEALDRNRYLRMDDFNDVYRTEIYPRIQELIKDSKAELEIPTIQYNDRGLGVFDFSRAAMGLVPIYKYYSFKKKDFVDGFDCRFVSGKKFKLIEDGTPAVIVPKILSDDKKLIEKIYKEVYDGKNVFDLLRKYNLRIGGTESISSSIKKVYQLKEKKPKPRNAIKIFVQIGYNANIVADDNCNGLQEQAKWTGYAAVGIAEILRSLGYAVSIIAVYGMHIQGDDDTGGIDVGGGRLQEGKRYITIKLKNFEDTLDTENLLYMISDASFFRIKMFDIIIKTCSFYRETLNYGLNRACTLREMERFIYTEYAPLDNLYKKSGEADPTAPMLYYTVGDVFSLNDLREIVLETALDVVNKNRVARDAMGL